MPINQNAAYYKCLRQFAGAEQAVGAAATMVGQLQPIGGERGAAGGGAVCGPGTDGAKGVALAILQRDSAHGGGARRWRIA